MTYSIKKMSISPKKIFLFSLKILFSGFCLWHLFDTFGSEFRVLQYSSFKLNWLYLGLGALFFFFSQIISVLRWQICCMSLDITSSQSKLDFNLVKLYWIGSFCNNFLPSSVGGDFVRAYFLKKNYSHSRWIDCAGSVFVDRAFGITALSWLGFIFLFLVHKMHSKLSFGITSGMGIIAIISTIIIFIGLYSNKFYTFPPDEKISEENKNWFQLLQIKFIEFCEALNKIKTHKFAILKLLGISFLIQILISICLFYLCKGLGFKINTLFIWIMNPLATLGSLFAPSLSGLGVREGIYAYMFKALGYSASNGIILSLTWFVIILFVSSPGAFYMLKQKK